MTECLIETCDCVMFESSGGGIDEYICATCGDQMDEHDE